MAKYIMVDVWDRKIVVHQYDNLEDAKRDLLDSLNEMIEEHNLGSDDYEISEDGMIAWANGGNDNYDWQIEEIY